MPNKSNNLPTVVSRC